MKKKLLTVLGLTMVVACVSACASNNTNQPADATESIEIKAYETYEFETFDGDKVAINEGNIISQEAYDEPLEWDGLPADAVQLAPGRDVILFADSTNYYVEDATKKLVTVAFQELGDVIEDTDVAIFDNNVFSFEFDPEYFTVTEDEDTVTVSFYNEDIQTAGSNVITFTKVENSDAKEVIKSYMEKYDASKDEMVENYLGGDDVKGYSYATLDLGAEGSDLKTREAYYAVPCGKDVILINKFRTVGPDMDLENSIDAQLDKVILSFKLVK